MKVSIICPNCSSKIRVVYGKNKWVEWFKGECWTCGYKFMLRDSDFETIQPSSPFFEMIYKFHPEKEAEKRRKLKRFEKEQRKAELEKKYYNKYKGNNPFSRRKPWEFKKLKEIVLEDKEF